MKVIAFVMTMRSLLLLQVTQAGTGYGFCFVESVLPLPRIPGSLLCPVAALVNHLRINQVPQDMPLFSVRSDSSLSNITYTHFSSFLARVIKAVGLDSATPLIVLGAVALPLPLKVKYHLSYATLVKDYRCYSKVPCPRIDEAVLLRNSVRGSKAESLLSVSLNE